MLDMVSYDLAPTTRASYRRLTRAYMRTVIHFVMTPAAGEVQIPAILNGEEPVPRNSELGSHDYSKKPICVILGGAYDDAGTAQMMTAVKDKVKHEAVKNLPWLRPDQSKAVPPLGPAYGEALVARIKEIIPQLEHDNKMGEAKVLFY